MTNEAGFAGQTLSTRVGIYTDSLDPEYLGGACLYFVRSQDGFCKIGKTRSLISRLHTLQNASPTPLRLEMYLPGMGWQEKVWHAAFSEWRRKGEWFVWNRHLAEAIETARIGDEWIATLPEMREWSPHWRSWRDIIADMEESAHHRLLNAYWDKHGMPMEDAA
jgi:hypothetical protein